MTQPAVPQPAVPQPAVTKSPSRSSYFFPSLRGYNRAWLRTDALAGASTAAVIVPAAMAYSSIAGLPPQTGLYTSLAGLVLYATLGMSPILSVSVTSTLALLTAGTISKLAPGADPVMYGQMAATLALVTGFVLMIAGLLRLGFVANFISEPVLTGAKAGLGLWIATGQLGKVLGIPFTNTDVFGNIRQVLSQLNAINPATLALSIVVLIVLFGLARYAPRIPGALVVVVLGIAAQSLFNLSGHGVALIQPIQPGLPTIAFPNLAYAPALLPAAFAIALMSALETIATGRLFARPSDPAISADREWIAVGAVNLGASLVQGFPTGGGTSQTAVNVRSGAKSQISQLVAAVVVALALTLLASFFNLIPEAVLGAIVLFVVSGLIKVTEIREISEIRARDAVLAIIAFLAVIFWGMLEGLVVAVVLSMLTLVYQSSRSPVYRIGRKPGTDEFRPLDENPTDETIDGLLIVRPEGGIYFANGDYIADHILSLAAETSPPVRVVLLDGKAVPDIEFTGLTSLGRLSRTLHQRGIELWAAALTPRALQMVERRMQQKELPQLHTYANVREAAKAYTSTYGNDAPPAKQV